jgi:hypothetical protein
MLKLMILFSVVSSFRLLPTYLHVKIKTKLFSTNSSNLPTYPAQNEEIDEWDSQITSKNFIPTGPSGLPQSSGSNNGLMQYKSIGDLQKRTEATLRYFQIVEKLSPNELLQKFAETAPKNVQEAAKSEISLL